MRNPDRACSILVRFPATLNFERKTLPISNNLSSPPSFLSLSTSTYFEYIARIKLAQSSSSVKFHRNWTALQTRIRGYTRLLQRLIQLGACVETSAGSFAPYRPRSTKLNSLRSLWERKASKLENLIWEGGGGRPAIYYTVALEFSSERLLKFRIRTRSTLYCDIYIYIFG